LVECVWMAKQQTTNRCFGSLGINYSAFDLSEITNWVDHHRRNPMSCLHPWNRLLRLWEPLLAWCGSLDFEKASHFPVEDLLIKTLGNSKGSTNVILGTGVDEIFNCPSITLPIWFELLILTPHSSSSLMNCYWGGKYSLNPGMRFTFPTLAHGQLGSQYPSAVVQWLTGTDILSRHTSFNGVLFLDLTFGLRIGWGRRVHSLVRWCCIGIRLTLSEKDHELRWEPTFSRLVPLGHAAHMPHFTSTSRNDSRLVDFPRIAYSLRPDFP